MVVHATTTQDYVTAHFLTMDSPVLVIIYYHNINFEMSLHFCVIVVKCPGNGTECNDQGTCDSSTGVCRCNDQHHGIACSGNVLKIFVMLYKKIAFQRDIALAQTKTVMVGGHAIKSQAIVIVTHHIMGMPANVMFFHILCVIITKPCITVKECPEYENKVCHDEGVCNRTEGTCRCNAGHFGTDCSSM